MKEDKPKEEIMNEIKTYEVKDVDGNMQTFYEGEIVLVSDDDEYWNMSLFGNISNGNIYTTGDGYLDLGDLYDYKYIKKLHPTIPEQWIINGVVYTRGEEVNTHFGNGKLLNYIHECNLSNVISHEFEEDEILPYICKVNGKIINTVTIYKLPATPKNELLTIKQMTDFLKYKKLIKYVSLNIEGVDVEFKRDDIDVLIDKLEQLKED